MRFKVRRYFLGIILLALLRTIMVDFLSKTEPEPSNELLANSHSVMEDIQLSYSKEGLKIEPEKDKQKIMTLSLQATNIPRLYEDKVGEIYDRFHLTNSNVDFDMKRLKSDSTHMKLLKLDPRVKSLRNHPISRIETTDLSLKQRVTKDFDKRSLQKPQRFEEEPEGIAYNIMPPGYKRHHRKNSFRNKTAALKRPGGNNESKLKVKNEKQEGSKQSRQEVGQDSHISMLNLAKKNKVVIDKKLKSHERDVILSKFHMLMEDKTSIVLSPQEFKDETISSEDEIYQGPEFEDLYRKKINQSNESRDKDLSQHEHLELSSCFNRESSFTQFVYTSKDLSDTDVFVVYIWFGTKRKAKDISHNTFVFPENDSMDKMRNDDPLFPYFSIKSNHRGATSSKLTEKHLYFNRNKPNSNWKTRIRKDLSGLKPLWTKSPRKQFNNSQSIKTNVTSYHHEMKKIDPHLAKESQMVLNRYKQHRRIMHYVPKLNENRPGLSNSLHLHNNSNNTNVFEGINRDKSLTFMKQKVSVRTKSTVVSNGLKSKSSNPEKSIECLPYITEIKPGHGELVRNQTDHKQGENDNRVPANLQWPWEDSSSDRILNQLSYVPDLYSNNDTTFKVIIAPGGIDPTQRGRKHFKTCPVSKCFLTDKKSFLYSADARLLQIGALKDEGTKPKHQIWILYMLESPSNVPNVDYLKDKINWTATYRHDSTLVTPYDKFVFFPNASHVYRSSIENYAQNKTRKIAWFVSNCGGTNNRMAFVEELQKYIDVDIYGQCGNFTCFRTKANECFKKLRQEYKFYLAFENSNCQDYITEKFFTNALKNDVVPIVMGARPEDYKRAAPWNSYIHVEDFKGPKELAKYLHVLDKNDTLYNKYFQWKGTGEYINTKFWCRLCAKLHSNTNTQRSWYDDIGQWFYGKHGSSCRYATGLKDWPSWNSQTV